MPPRKNENSPRKISGKNYIGCAVCKLSSLDELLIADIPDPDLRDKVEQVGLSFTVINVLLCLVVIRADC